jgi:hypothetical protein
MEVFKSDGLAGEKRKRKLSPEEARQVNLNELKRVIEKINNPDVSQEKKSSLRNRRHDLYRVLNLCGDCRQNKKFPVGKFDLCDQCDKMALTELPKHIGETDGITGFA